MDSSPVAFSPYLGIEEARRLLTYESAGGPPSPWSTAPTG